MPRTQLEPVATPNQPRMSSVLAERRVRTVPVKIERRRAGREQGVALERLAHAVEYLVDSRMFLTSVPYTRSEDEAVKILMGLNRQVFEECPIVVGLGTRLRNGIRRMLRDSVAKPS
jgi:hypothetical protein